MTIEAAPPSLNESLDHEDGDAPPRRRGRARGAFGTCARAPRARGANFAATARRLPDVQPSRVADGDLPTEEDQP